jgi:hypothetical protein
MIINLETKARTGRWRDPSNPYEGHLFQTVLSRVGINATGAQISFVITMVMFMFWVMALFRMLLLQN